MKIQLTPAGVIGTWEHGELCVPEASLTFGHLGCKLIASIPPKERPAPVAATLTDRRVAKDRPALHGALAVKDMLDRLSRSNLSLRGITLVDTMRGGSDYWRGGKLLTELADHLRALVPDARVSYARIDALCPPRQLLDRARAEAMSFGAYATGYAEYLRAGDTLDTATELVLRCLACEGEVPLFVCTDPYVEGFNAGVDTTRPYAQRGYSAALSAFGCHRVVLVEELARHLAKRGIGARVVEIDGNRDRTVVREFGVRWKS